MRGALGRWAAWAVGITVLSSSCGPALMWHSMDPTRTREVQVYGTVGNQFVVERESGEQKSGAAYTAVGYELLSFSPDGEHLAYPALLGESWTLIVDERAIGLYEGIGEVVFRADSSEVGFAAREDEGWVVVRVPLDGGAPRVGEPAEEILAETLGYGDDGRLSYVARDGGFVRVVVEGRRGPEMNGVAELRRAPGSGRVGYLGRRGTACAALLEDVPEDAAGAPVRHGAYGPKDSTGCRDFRFGAEGARFAFSVDRGEKGHCLVLDGVEKPETCGLKPGSVRLAPKTRRVAYVVKEGDQERAVIDDEPQEPYESVRPVVFGQGGDYYAYIAHRDGSARIVLNGREHFTRRFIRDLRLSVRGSHVAYLSASHDEGEWSVTRDGRHLALPGAVSGTLVLSDRGEHWGCLVHKGAEVYVVMDGSRIADLDISEFISRLKQGARDQANVIRGMVRDSMERRLRKRPRLPGALGR